MQFRGEQESCNRPIHFTASAEGSVMEPGEPENGSRGERASQGRGCCLVAGADETIL